MRYGVLSPGRTTRTPDRRPLDQAFGNPPTAADEARFESIAAQRIGRH